MRGIPRHRTNDRAAARLRNGHVWVYASDVLDESGAAPGALVHVVGPKDKPLGTAIYSSASQIKLRLLTRELLASEEDLLRLLRQRLQEAVGYRKQMVQDSDACRLIFSEAHRLPGLIVDRYNDIYSIQVLAQAWDRPERRQAIINGIRELAQAEHIVERVDERIRALEQLPELASSVVHGSNRATVFAMNGIKFHY